MELVPEVEFGGSDSSIPQAPARVGTDSDLGPDPNEAEATDQPPRTGWSWNPVEMVRWVQLLAHEVAMIPWTIRETRRSLAELPDRLDRLSVTLERTMVGLDTSLPQLNEVMGEITAGVGSVEGAVHELNGELGRTVFALDQLLPELSGMMNAVDTRMAHMDQTVSELGAMARGILGAIPGVRRTVRRPSPNHPTSPVPPTPPIPPTPPTNR